MKILIILIMIFLMNCNQEYAFAYDRVIYLCKYSWENIAGQQCNSMIVEESYVDEGEICGGSEDENCGGLGNGDSSILSRCYLEFLEGYPSYSKLPYQDIKKGSLNISAPDFIMSDYSYDYYREVRTLIESNKNEFGCGEGEGNNPDDECLNLYQYLYEKLSSKFPLDIFVPTYNFQAESTACPKINLFGGEYEFCAIVMVAKSIKYIILIKFIIQSVMSL